VSDELNNYLDQQIISHYQQQAVKENEAVMAKIQKDMTKKNQQLAKKGGNPGVDPFTKKKEPVKMDKTYFEKHTIGVLTIPEINVHLPIFDETNTVLLEKGASLLEGTSYPTGGESTHAVISSHRGLPQAKLFTDLPKLTFGDSFYIEINGQTLAYQVDQIKTVEPTDTKDLRIEKGKDFVTLLTCTPYMINSHRLLVRGHRIPYHAKKVQKEVQKVSENKRFFLYGLIAISILIFLFLIYLFRQTFKIRNRR
ncbi:class C sortase, partial [Enterococcus faecium]|uniref:class C sortase n=1 Tax=Enterococcus faecium TaxID=1352 RepID=UPI000CF1CD75